MRDAIPYPTHETEADPFQEDGRGFQEYWRVIARHKAGILGLALLAGIIGALLAYSMEPIYRATITLVIESKPANVGNLEEVFNVNLANRQYYETQYRILRSRALIRQLMERSGLWKDPEFDPERRPSSQAKLHLDWQEFLPAVLAPQAVKPHFSDEQIKERAINVVLQGLTVEPVQGSQLVNVHFVSRNRDLSAKVLNELAEAYIYGNLEARMERTQRVASWLSERLEGMRKKLDDSEQELQRFREDAKLVSGETQGSFAARKLDDTAGGLLEASKRRKELEVIFQEVRAKGGDLSKLVNIPAVLGHDLVRPLRQQELEAEQAIAQLGKRYGPQHPKMIQATSELAAVRSNLRRQVQIVANGIAKEYEAARDRELDLKRQLRSNEAEVQSVNRKMYRLNLLEREVESNRQLYNLFLNRMKETSAAGDWNSTYVRVLDPAETPKGAYKPDKQRIILIASILGLFVGLALAFLLEQLDNTLKGVDDIESKLVLPVLGMLPRIKTRGRKDNSPLRYFLDKSKSEFAESIRTIRTGVLLSAIDDPHKVLVVTSSIPGEGKSTVAMNLAFALGHLKKVLLIDADMRRPSVAQVCGFPKDAAGLSHLVAGTAQVSECIHPIEGTSIHVIPSGIVPPNPLELLSSRRFGEVLEKLSQAFDHIVIDTAPSMAVSDALVVSTHAKAVIYVVKADNTPYGLAQNGVKRLRQVGAPLVGVVLNHVNTKRSAHYGKYGAGYYYGNGYYGHYGYAGADRQ